MTRCRADRHARVRAAARQLDCLSPVESVEVLDPDAGQLDTYAVAATMREHTIPSDALQILGHHGLDLHPRPDRAGRAVLQAAP